MQKLIAVSVLVACVILGSHAVAAGHPHRYRLVLPCFPTATWVRMARTNRLEPIDTRMDDDGDTWVIWEVEGRGYWRSTMTPKGGTTTCIISGSGNLRPAPAGRGNI